MNNMLEVWNAQEPPLEIALDSIRTTLKHKRIAFAGRAGAGKSTLANIISSGSYPIINHSDALKEEVLEWLTDISFKDLEPDSNEAFQHFVNFTGISLSRIQEDLWYILGPVYTAFTNLYIQSRKLNLPTDTFISLGQGINLDEKIKFVDRHKNIFRTSLQKYGEMSKEIAADEEYWVHQTLNRSLEHPICFNSDTRFAAEMECLRNCGWTGIYLFIDDETQKIRRPEMSDLERSHISEWSIGPEHCDFVVDGRNSLSSILMEITTYLNIKRYKNDSRT
jgi:energy-coupling factor transporter ATP-binding protein EcfA2